MDSRQRKELRIGILCNGPVLQHWQAECLRHVLAVPGVELVVVIERAQPAADGTKGMLERAWTHPWRSVLYRQYRDRWSRPKAMLPEDLAPLFSNVPLVRVCPRVEKGAEWFSAHDLDSIREFRPDVLFRFGFNILRGELLTLPTYGVWSYHHGDEMRFRGGPPGLWEIFFGVPVTGAVLQRLTERLDAGAVLKKGWFATVDHSHKETIDTVLMHSGVWAAQLVRSLLAGDNQVVVGTVSRTEAKVHRYPGNVDFVRFLLRLARNKYRFHRQGLKLHEEWNIGVLYQPIQELLKDPPDLNVRWLPAPGQGTYRADPFGVLDRQGSPLVLYEKYDYATGIGEISRIRPKRDNVLKRSRTILSTGTHLSYPFVLQHEGRTFVVPEASSTGKVTLFESDPELTELREIATLLEEALYDPTLVAFGGRWWMFGTKAPLTNAELFLYHADSLFGPFEPHMLNPVKCDVRSSRPAGTPFWHDGQLHRPAQDSSTTYGSRVAINRILRMDKTAFEEETVKFVGPVGGTVYDKGFHTISAVGPFTLVDGKRMVHLKNAARRATKMKMERLLQRDRSAS
ncbi:MAG: hypothetical protein KDB88_04320 [Flavobacteriales bacterium]|nr:hypothetical protein [Flavobacteriales bacterium]